VYLSKVSWHGVNVTSSGFGCSIGLAKLVLFVAVLATLLGASRCVSVIGSRSIVVVIVVFIAIT
jgi:hypothetical protein